MAKKASTTSKSVVLNFTRERETKNTVRYAEDGDEPTVGILYVKKAAVESLGNPESLSVTINAGS